MGTSPGLGGGLVGYHDPNSFEGSLNAFLSRTTYVNSFTDYYLEGPMATLMIGYDLNRPGQNYAELISAIQGLGAWWHYLDSTWIVKTNLNTVQVRDRLSAHIDKNDELLVAALSGEAAWAGFNEQGSDWLKANLK